jgi:hypothetical protein
MGEIALTGAGYSPMKRFCEDGNELSDSIKTEKLLTSRVIISFS